jgi:hypothetical protein
MYLRRRPQPRLHRALYPRVGQRGVLPGEVDAAFGLGDVGMDEHHALP